MLRKALSKSTQSRHKGFHFRGHEVKRIETFSDAVFAFAVTLLIVSLEVPKSFEELMVTMRGFFAFAISFLFLLMIWYQQHVYFRRYGLEDITVVWLNGILMFVVLFYVYPLKFLFTLMFSDQIYAHEKNPFSISAEQFPTLMSIYGIGYIVIYALFLLMYLHVLNKKEQLNLSEVEVFDTKTRIYANGILVCIGMLAVIMAHVLPAKNAGASGFTYILIGPVFSIVHARLGKKRKKLFPHAGEETIGDAAHQHSST